MVDMYVRPPFGPTEGPTALGLWITETEQDHKTWEKMTMTDLTTPAGRVDAAWAEMWHRLIEGTEGPPGNWYPGWWLIERGALASGLTVQQCGVLLTWHRELGVVERQADGLTWRAATTSPSPE